jgi:hypothetical protein
MAVWTRFINLWRRGALDREFDDELRFHREMQIARNLERGMDRAAAEAEARRRCGSDLRAREGMHEARVMTGLESCTNRGNALKSGTTRREQRSPRRHDGTKKKS